MGAMASQITNFTIVISIVYSGAGQENIKAPRHWPLCEEFTGEFPAQSFIWWRHHDWYTADEEIFTSVLSLQLVNLSCFHHRDMRVMLSGITAPQTQRFVQQVVQAANNEGIKSSHIPNFRSANVEVWESHTLLTCKYLFMLDSNLFHDNKRGPWTSCLV